MKKILLVMAALFMVSGCSTMSVDIDYDTAYDFDAKTKYAVVHSDREGDNTLVNDRIAAAIKESLNKRSYKEVSKDEADLVFVFHVNVTQRSDVRSDFQVVGYGGYGYGRGFGGYGGGYGTRVVEVPSTYSWKEGKLIIDALNPQNKKIVWRGAISDELTRSETTPAEKTKYVNEVVAKLLKKFPKN